MWQTKQARYTNLKRYATQIRNLTRTCRLMPCKQLGKTGDCHTPQNRISPDAGEFIGTKTPPLTDQRDQFSRRTEQPVRHRTNPSTPPIPYGADPEDYYTKTQAKLPRKHALPHDSTQHIRPESRHTSPGINTKRRHSYRDQMETIPNNNDEQRRPRSRGTFNGKDDRQERNRIEEQRFSDTRNVHRKRKTATTKETVAW